MDYVIVKDKWKPILLTLFSISCSFFTACSTQEEINPEVHSFLLTHLYQNFAEAGMSLGFDLDKRISDENDPMGCYQADFEDAEGNRGIDNGYGSLLPFLEASEVNIFGNLLEDGFTNEIIPILLRISDVQDEYNDDSVVLQSILVSGPLMFGADGQVLDGQTLEAVYDDFVITENARIENGILMAEEFPFFNALSSNFVISLEDDRYFLESVKGATGAIRATFTKDGLSDGIISTSTPVDLLNNDFDDVSMTELLDDHLMRAADMSPDHNGICREISSVYLFESIPVHLYGD